MLSIDESIRRAYASRKHRAVEALSASEDLLFEAPVIADYLYRRRRSVLRFENGTITLGGKPSEMLTEAFYIAPVELTEAARLVGIAIAR